ncbi:MAG: DUF1343 domain-containing protein [Rhodothermales bacterium]|nr:DUF1343 domain-containing protein [Rhodothermales bacterium]
MHTAYVRLVVAALALLAGCASPAPLPEAMPPAPTRIRTGAEVLADEGFARLAGLRVGLIANHTSRVDSTHLADRLHAAGGIELVALFGPEHGIRGDAVAGAYVEGSRDSSTGVPVHSLYGRRTKPTPEQLAGIDVLLFDIQDIGARFYTYISTMGLAMQAAAAADIPFYVLDRPNPLGGVLVEGFVLEPEYTSFVGAYPIPVVHGLTVGELARMIQGEGWMEGIEALDLHVVPMLGWRRAMGWDATGLPWTPPSPNIPDVATAVLYPGTCFFEGVQASEGRGTYEPFKQVGAPGADGKRLAEALNGVGLPGVRFAEAGFTPVSIPGMATTPRFAGVALGGVRAEVMDLALFRPVATGIHVVVAFYQAAAETERSTFLQPSWLNNLAGTRRLVDMLEAGMLAEGIVEAWQAEVAAFEARRAPYLLYE